MKNEIFGQMSIDDIFNFSEKMEYTPESEESGCGTILPLRESKSIEDIYDFLGEHPFVGCCRYDSVSVVAYYSGKSGELKRLGVRGMSGECVDISRFIGSFEGLPRKISARSCDDLVVCGELILPEDDFSRINAGGVFTSVHDCVKYYLLEEPDEHVKFGFKAVEFLQGMPKKADGSSFSFEFELYILWTQGFSVIEHVRFDKNTRIEDVKAQLFSMKCAARLLGTSFMLDERDYSDRLPVNEEYAANGIILI